MPKRYTYGRKYKSATRGRRSYGRKSMYSGERAAASLARQAYRGVQYLKGLVNSELQKYDVQLTANITTTPTTTHLSNISQGDSDAGRTGNSVLAKYVAMNGRYTAVAGNSIVRTVVVRDKQQIGDSYPAYNTVFESNSVNALLNTDSVGRFTILYDKLNIMSDTDTYTQCWKAYIKLDDHVRYNGSAVTDIQKNGVYLLQVANVLVVGQETNARFAFHDN